MTKCTSCDGKDFQHRYAVMMDEYGWTGQLCAECFSEWLGVDRSRRKAILQGEMKKKVTK